MRGKTPLSRKNNTKTSFFSNDKILLPSNPKFSVSVLLTYLFTLAKSLPNPYYFTHHGNNYRLSTTANNSSAHHDQVGTGFFQAVSGQIAASACGNVTVPQEIPLQWNTTVSTTFCNRVLELARDASQISHETFEDCLRLLNSAEQEKETNNCVTTPNKVDAGTSGVAFALILGGFLLVLAGIVYLLFKKLNAKKGYEEINPTETPGIKYPL